MGTLRSTDYDIIIDEEGNETYVSNVKGHSFNGVTFGDPVELDGNPATHEFDDSAFPNGTVEIVDGEVVVVIDEPAIPVEPPAESEV